MTDKSLKKERQAMIAEYRRIPGIPRLAGTVQLVHLLPPALLGKTSPELSYGHDSVNNQISCFLSACRRGSFMLALYTQSSEKPCNRAEYRMPPF